MGRCHHLREGVTTAGPPKDTRGQLAESKHFVLPWHRSSGWALCPSRDGKNAGPWWGGASPPGGPVQFPLPLDPEALLGQVRETGCAVCDTFCRELTKQDSRGSFLKLHIKNTMLFPWLDLNISEHQSSLSSKRKLGGEMPPL